jgi:hypothetical protein
MRRSKEEKEISWILHPATCKNARNPDLRCTLLPRTVRPSVEETRPLRDVSVRTYCASVARFRQER